MTEALVVTGIGVVSAIGQGKRAFGDALLRGDGAFDIMHDGLAGSAIRRSSAPRWAR